MVSIQARWDLSSLLPRVLIGIVIGYATPTMEDALRRLAKEPDGHLISIGRASMLISHAHTYDLAVCRISFRRTNGLDTVIVCVRDYPKLVEYVDGCGDVHELAEDASPSCRFTMMEFLSVHDHIDALRGAAKVWLAANE